MKKVLSILLACVLLLTAGAFLVSCGSNDTPASSGSQDKSGDPASAGPVVSTEKFNDKFVILGSLEWQADPEDTDIVAHAQYMRNTDLEERFGITLTSKDLVYHQIPDAVNDAAKSGDATIYDMVMSQITFSSNIVLAGNAVDFYTIPYVDLEQEWWPATNREDLTLNDQCYMVLSSFSLSTIGHTFGQYFNKKLAEKYNFGDLYAIADAGGWTFDVMYDLVKDVRDDLNSDGRYNAKDLYGLAIGDFTANTIFIAGFDNPVFRRDPETNDLVFSYYSDKLVKTMTKLVKLYYRTDGVYYDDGKDVLPMFVNGQTVLANGMFTNMAGDIRDMTDWGLLPLPKYNKSQQDYYSLVGGGCNALIIPELHGNDKKMEKIGSFLEYSSYLSTKDLQPAFYDRALKGKYADSPKEAGMIDIIMATRHMDFGVYLGFEGPSFVCQGMLSAKNDKISSRWEQEKDKFNAKCTDLYEAFGLEFDGID